MIVILYQDGCRDVAERISSQLLKTFADKVEVLLVAAETDTTWPAAASWDDLLIVIFSGKDFPAPGNRFIELYLQKRPDTAQLLPIANDPAVRKPPEAAAAWPRRRAPPTSRQPAPSTSRRFQDPCNRAFDKRSLLT